MAAIEGHDAEFHGVAAETVALELRPD
jgi:hypothetical protein